MGCGSSRSAVVPAPLLVAQAKSANAPGTNANGVVRVAVRSKTAGSADSRMNSADSGISHCSSKSTDSGIGGDESQVITEKSTSELKEAADLPDDYKAPKLAIEGTKMRVPPPSQTHRRRSTQTSLKPAPLPPIGTTPGQLPNVSQTSAANPRVSFCDEENNSIIPDDPNIIKRPCSRTWLAFDILLDDAPQEEDLRMERRRPTALRRLERKGERMTLEKWEEKHRAVAERKKVHDYTYSYI